MRDEFVRKLDKIYRNQPLTNNKAYKQTRRALKKDEEQFFSNEEIDKMLPKELRVCIHEQQ